MTEHMSAPARRERERIHAVAFDSAEGALEGTRAFRAHGFEVRDVHTPFAVHGMDEAMGLRETRLPVATLCGGILGCSLGMGFQMWTHAVSWPLNIGGKTNVAWPALVPIGFEVTVLLAAFATVGALLVRGRLFPRLTGRMPVSQPHARVTDDRFVVLITERDASFSPEHFRTLCERVKADEVVGSWGVV